MSQTEDRLDDVAAPDLPADATLGPVAVPAPRRGWTWSADLGHAPRDDEWPGWRWIRAGLLAAYGVAFVLMSARRGVGFDREYVIAWICGALALTCVGRPPRRMLQLVIDWVPVVGVFILYDLTRGLADGLGMPVHVRPQLDADRFLFAGTVPTTWLQDHVIGEHVQKWELILSLTYASYFVVPFVVGGVLWARSRPRWKHFMRRFLTLQFAALATYVLAPGAPPWMAADQGLIPPVDRTVGRGWSVLNLHFAQAILDKGRATANPVAALPSLHAAMPMLITLYFWKRVGRFGKVVLAVYPPLMAFTLVATGEHYVFDVLLGWSYAVVIMVGWSQIERWWARRAAARLGAPPPPVLTLDDALVGRPSGWTPQPALLPVEADGRAPPPDT